MSKGPSRRWIGYGVVAMVLIAASIFGLLKVIASDGSRSNACAPKTQGDASGCGLYWGAALNSVNSKLQQSVQSNEASTKRRLDIVHTYHRWNDVFPTASEVAIARSGRMLFLNWEPVDASNRAMSWAGIARGDRDVAISQLADRLRAVGTPIMLSFSHEPESRYREHGTAADFAAAYRHVHDVMTKRGVTNVRWVWNVMGLSDPVWLNRYATLWPGDSYVDWVAWDPYNWSACGDDPWHSFEQTVKPFYDWLTAHGHGNKPFMLAEYGSVERSGDPDAKSEWFQGIPDALKKLPNLRALVYFDYPAPPANCDWRVDTSTASRVAYDELAGAEAFEPTSSINLKAGN